MKPGNIQRVFDADRKEEFCEALAKCGVQVQACREVSVSQKTVKDHRHKDPAFEDAFREAMAAYRGLLHKEAHRRAVDGVEKKVFNRDQEIDKIRMYSDRLLELLLKRHDPAFHDHTVVDQKTEITATLSDDLSELSEEEQETLRKLLESRQSKLNGSG